MNSDSEFPKLETLRERAARQFPAGAGENRDHLAWAKRILWRHERNDKSLRPIQISFARMALAVE